jgi:hypothetical protein
MLVRADGAHPELNCLRGQADGTDGRGAAVVDVGKREAGQAQLVHDGVGIVDLLASAKGELDVTPPRAVRVASAPIVIADLPGRGRKDAGRR